MVEAPLPADVEPGLLLLEPQAASRTARAADRECFKHPERKTLFIFSSPITS
jgi:hypothetical protein